MERWRETPGSRNAHRSSPSHFREYICGNHTVVITKVGDGLKSSNLPFAQSHAEIAVSERGVRVTPLYYDRASDQNDLELLQSDLKRRCLAKLRGLKRKIRAVTRG